MKILIFSDVHWSTNSSIIRTNSEKYSTRLEYLIAGINWINELAIQKNCEAMICAGDFFDKPQCSDEEITALREVKWNNLPCYFLCGNHESSVSDLRYSSLKILESKNHFIISEPTVWKYNNDENEIRFLPYIIESNRKNIDEYFWKCLGKNIFISHNDLAGVHYGLFESKIGFSVEEINANCDLYLNGHLHNSEWISPKILNVGSISGHNFTNDSSRYKYGIWILDTDTLTVEFIENPYGLNFYKVEIMAKKDLKILESLKNNAVVFVKCNSKLFEDCKKKISELKNILEKRITIVRDLEVSDQASSIEDLHGTDYLEKLVNFCKANINNSDILDQELNELCK